MTESALTWPELGAAAACPPALRNFLNTLLGSAAPLALFWGPSFLTYYSNAFRALMSVEHPSAWGRPGSECLGEIWDGQLRAVVEGVARSGESSSVRKLQLERDVRGPLGDMNLDLACDPVRNEAGAVLGVLCNATRVTERVADADAIASASRAKAYLAAIVDSADDAIIAKDLNSIIQACNAAGERLFGYTAAELIGQSVRILIPPGRQSEEDAELELFDKLEDYTVACGEVHSRYLSVTQSPNELAATVQEAQEARDRLLADAVALANRGLVDGSQLKELIGVVGYKNLSVDLSIVVQALRAAWPNIQGKSPITEAELDRAHKLHLYLMRIVGLKEQGSAAISAATELRIRAFTMRLRAYEHVRRFVSFLRYHEEDLETIAPTLYAGRPRRKTTDAPNANGTQAPGTTTTPGTGTTTTPHPVATTAASAPAGVPPINEPFMS